MTVCGTAWASAAASFLPSTTILSVAVTRSPSVAFFPLTETRPAEIQASISRREPKPARARTFCNFSSILISHEMKLWCGSPASRFLYGVCLWRVIVGALLALALALSLLLHPVAQDVVQRAGGERGGFLKGEELTAQGTLLLRGLLLAGQVEHAACRCIVLEAQFLVERRQVTYLREARQLVEAFQAKVVEKLARGGIHGGAAGHIAVTHHADPLAVEQGTRDAGAHRDAADLLDVATGDGLAVGDNGDGFQQRARISLRLLVPQAPYPLAELLPYLEAVARSHLSEFKAALGAIRRNRLQRILDHRHRRALVVVEDSRDLLQAEWLGGRQQQSFDDLLEFRLVVHDMRSPTRRFGP